MKEAEASGADLTVQSDRLSWLRAQREGGIGQLSFPGGVAVLARRFQAGRTI